MAEKLEHVGPVDPTLKTSPIVEDDSEEQADSSESSVEAKSPEPQPPICWYNGKEYSPGAEICAAGWRMQCQSSGYWRKFGGKC